MPMQRAALTALPLAVLLAAAEARDGPSPGAASVSIGSDGVATWAAAPEQLAERTSTAALVRRQRPPLSAAAPAERWSGGFSFAALEEAAEATSRLHTPSSESERAQHGSVLYVVYSDSEFYDTRLQWDLETWAGKLPRSALVVIGDAAPPPGLGARVHQTRCPPHSHWEGACCKYAEAVILAQKLMRRDPSFSWAYFTDDDAYVRTEMMGRALARKLDAADARGTVLGNFGCNTPDCEEGLCAGGGYAASAMAVDRLVDGNPAAFLAEQMQNCGKCGRWADVAMSRIVMKRGINEAHLEGLNGWQLNKGCFDETLANTDFEPLMYHYIRSRSQMQFLHGLFSPRVNATEPDVSNSTSPCANFHDQVQCAVSEQPEERPWIDADVACPRPRGPLPPDDEASLAEQGRVRRHGRQPGRHHQPRSSE